MINSVSFKGSTDFADLVNKPQANSIAPAPAAAQETRGDEFAGEKKKGSKLKKAGIIAGITLAAVAVGTIVLGLFKGKVGSMQAGDYLEKNAKLGKKIQLGLANASGWISEQASKIKNILPKAKDKIDDLDVDNLVKNLDDLVE